jgi:dihydrofolate reductase
MEAILAIDLKNGLSKNGSIPWNSKKDMNFFFNKTKHNVVIMGKNTYFSLPEEVRPLKNRANIVLTREPEIYLNYETNCSEKNLVFTNNFKIYNSIINNREKYYRLFHCLNRNFKIYIIGGKFLYEELIPICETVWLTRIKKDYSCDLFFDYNFSIQFKEKIIDEDEELQIIKYDNSTIKP